MAEKKGLKHSAEAGAGAARILVYSNDAAFAKSSASTLSAVPHYQVRHQALEEALFDLDGKSYKLAKNNGVNCLHGGLRGFDKVVWKATPGKGASVQFNYTSPDGEEGFPGKLDVTVVMSLTDRNELSIEYTAVTNKPTPVNLTNHTYFNLACGGDIKAHKLILASDFYTPVNGDLIPTGEIRSVLGALYPDCRTPVRLMEHLVNEGLRLIVKRVRSESIGPAELMD